MKGMAGQTLRDLADQLTCQRLLVGKRQGRMTVVIEQDQFVTILPEGLMTDIADQ